MHIISDEHSVRPLFPIVAAFAASWGPEFWSAQDVQASLATPGTKLVLAPHHSGDTREPAFTSLLLVREVVEEAEVFFIYTLPAFRGQGLGRQLLEWMLAAWRAQGIIKSCFLEVRPSNVAAKQLYERTGFLVAQRRKSYYRDGEDALIYEWRA